MKKFSLLLLLGMFAFAFTADAQVKKGQRLKGYLLDNQGKKIEGTILAGDWADNQIKVNFIKKGSGKKVVYKPTQLKGFAYEEPYTDCAGKKKTRWVEYFTMEAERPSRMFGPTTVFMEREVTGGAYDLFCFYVEVRTNVAKPYKYSFYIVDKKTKKTTIINEEGYKAKTTSVFKDYWALRTRVGKKDFEFKNMDRMVRDYNYYHSNGHDTNEYRVALKEE